MSGRPGTPGTRGCYGSAPAGRRSARVGPVAGAELQAAYDPERSFAFGLARLLDGIAALVVG